jgi:hypothetical protein
MRKIFKRFEDIWYMAEARNRAEGRHRFHQINCLNRKYVTLGIYDSVTKKYCLFDTINLVGNFRYNHKEIPREFQEMEDLCKG